MNKILGCLFFAMPFIAFFTWFSITQGIGEMLKYLAILGIVIGFITACILTADYFWNK